MTANIQSRLFEMKDDGYRRFQCSLMPSVDPLKVIGVRTPLLRKLASDIRNDSETETFLHTLPHTYYDENNLHAFIISLTKDYRKCLSQTDEFLPYIDNWATCDQMNPHAFNGHPELLKNAELWICSGKTYTVRFGLGILMRHFLGSQFTPECLELAASVRSSEYYVNMMTAWFFATALAKRYDETISYIESGRLDGWTQRKAIQKSIESRRLTDGHKEYLRSLSKPQ